MLLFIFLQVLTGISSFMFFFFFKYIFRKEKALMQLNSSVGIKTFLISHG